MDRKIRQPLLKLVKKYERSASKKVAQPGYLRKHLVNTSLLKFTHKLNVILLAHQKIYTN